MLPELEIARCLVCGHHVFPAPVACSQCGSPSLVAEPAGPGTVENAVDILRSPSGGESGAVHILLVHLDKGPRVLARCDGSIRVGDRVSAVEEFGAAIARAADGE